jgi:uncharacterized protein with GYD domain
MEAYCFIQTETPSDVAKKLRLLEGMHYVDVIGGGRDYDIVALVSAEDISAIHELIKTDVWFTPGVTRTVTCPLPLDRQQGNQSGLYSRLVYAYVLIEARISVQEVIVEELSSAREVDSVAAAMGFYDIVVCIAGENKEKINRFINAEIDAFSGVDRTSVYMVSEADERHLLMAASSA